jgi:hypothetical protein
VAVASYPRTALDRSEFTQRRIQPPSGVPKPPRKMSLKASRLPCHVYHGQQPRELPSEACEVVEAPAVDDKYGQLVPGILHDVMLRSRSGDDHLPCLVPPARDRAVQAGGDARGRSPWVPGLAFRYHAASPRPGRATGVVGEHAPHARG